MFSIPPSLSLISINEEPSALPPAELERLPFIPYEERFEQEGKWLLGQMILAKICRYMKDKSIIATIDPSQYSRLLVSLPEFPKVRNELDGEMVSIYWMIPEELRCEFDVCCSEVMEYRTNDLMLLEDRMLPCIADQTSVHRANAILSEFENARIAIGNPNDPPLWECLAERFGLPLQLIDAAAEPFK